jgi:very-short-patch-repair endonuclease
MGEDRWGCYIVKNCLTPFAKQLRKRPTDAEDLLWRHLQRRQIEGFKFRRQQPIGKFIVDFVCLTKKIVIEIDGGQHAVYKESDNIRDAWLKANGFSVLRFWNTALFENLEGVLETIRNVLLSPSLNPSRQWREVSTENKHMV